MASVVIPGGGGITPKFKWQGWSNGEKYQNPKKFLKPPTNINPTQKNPMPNFRALKICRMYWILKEPQNTEQLKQVWFILYSQSYAAGIRWPTTSPQIDLNLPKQNPYLNQANQKILPNFPTKKIPESNPKSPPWSSRLFNPGVLYPLSLLLGLWPAQIA